MRSCRKITQLKVLVLTIFRRPKANRAISKATLEEATGSRRVEGTVYLIDDSGTVGRHMEPELHQHVVLNKAHDLVYVVLSTIKTTDAEDGAESSTTT